MSDNLLRFIDDEGNEKQDSLFLNGYIKKFNELLQSTNYSIYSFTGEWGSGKTTFIKLWEKTLKASEYIHIDAFEMDYETEPFMMFIKHFYKYLKDQETTDKELLDDFINKAKNIFSRSVKTLPKDIINIITSKLVGDENAKDLISDFREILFDELVIKESEEATLYEKLKNVLRKITEKLEKPIYVVVDELDRCRPPFALETLEKIKHIFQIKNIKFILVYNNYILESIIEKTYGISNGNRYLDKFIQKSILINNDTYFNRWFFQEVDNLRENYPGMQRRLVDLERSVQIFSNIKKVYNISLRDFQTLFSNLLNYNEIPYPPEGNKVFLMIIVFEIFKLLDNKKYITMKNIVENNGQLDINSPESAMILNLKSLVRCGGATSEEINDIFKQYISGAYN